ncbi:MAG: hypothetical protein LUB63_03590 [Oscillospiraceae bacterium]|nr:hypothetical protein [Oscillospiraceae bacterium]
MRRQLAWAAGADFFRNRDPLYHVTESFQQTFDAIGRRHVAQLAQQGGRDTEAAGTQQQGDQPDATGARFFYERGASEDQDLFRRFSETAFQRGTLSGAVLQGSGQMMLFSCLKKTVGQSQPDKWQQRKLFEKASPHRNIPGPARRKVVFNRGFTDSAVGLVVDTLRDARRTVEDMAAMAQGKSEMGQAGADTLITLYPFLDDRKERELLQTYRAQLERLDEGVPQRSILQNAAGRTEALIAKKAQMKAEFINKLRFVSDRAAEALEVFEQPGFAEALDTALREALTEEDAEPGEDGDDGTPGADNPQGGGAPDGGAES